MAKRWEWEDFMPVQMGLRFGDMNVLPVPWKDVHKLFNWLG